MLRRFAEIAREAEPREHLDAVVRDVDFPPEEALVRGRLIIVMIVVPALAERDEREDQRVAAGVRRAVAAAAEQVRQRVDEERAVIEEHGRQEEPDEEHAPPACRQQADGEHRRGHEVVPVQPHELGVLREVGDRVGRRVVVLLAQNPADVGPPEAAARRVDVGRHVRVLVVMAVMPGPPQHALLRGRRTAERHDELHHAPELVRAVAEVAVVTRRDEEHAQGVEGHTHDDVAQLHPGPQRAEGREVHQDEGDGGHEVHALFGAAFVALVGDRHVSFLQGSCLDPVRTGSRSGRHLGRKASGAAVERRSDFAGKRGASGQFH